jgi:SAM-dependent methyltransferase
MTDWNRFWSSYRKIEVKSDADLFREVGKTVMGEPLSQDAFQISIALIVDGLDLSKQDLLLELGCGNGLVTRRLAPLVKQIRAVDFSERLIENAKKFSRAMNVSYFCGEAMEHLHDLVVSKEYVPTKILLVDCLAYFDVEALRSMLLSARRLTADHFVFMASGVPCDHLKWNFYNTPERVRRFEENQLLSENTNDGIGRWWRKAELEEIANALDLRIEIREQPTVLANYRIDAVYTIGRKVDSPAGGRIE